jgi:branched-subunit amino acid transport protein
VDRQLTIWLLILSVGVITYAARMSFIAFFARRAMPPWLAEALKHVPVAMITAIIVPSIAFVSPGALQLDPGNAKLVAALAAGAVAWWSSTGRSSSNPNSMFVRQSAVLTIAAGMIALWLLQYLVG